MQIEIGKTYIFTKSGNHVRVIEQDGLDMWLVERTAGASVGKRMIVPSHTLMDVHSKDWS